jgi:hypothetical protein
MPLGIVGFLQIEGDGNMAFDGGDIGGGSRARVLGGRGVDSLAHISGAAVEFVLASLEKRLMFLQLLFKLLELVGRHGDGGRGLGWAARRGRRASVFRAWRGKGGSTL